jgi:hypothetical protein
MAQSYLTDKQKLNDIASYADQENKRFGIWTQKDADMLFGKIRRLTGRDNIRRNAIAIITRKKLKIPDNLLSTWEDPVQEEFSTETNPMNAEFKYIPRAERDALPNSDFGYISPTDKKRRLFPVRNQEDLDAAAKLIGRAKGLNDKDRENVKKKLTAIAKRKGLTIPKTWQESQMSDDNLVTIG